MGNFPKNIQDISRSVCVYHNFHDSAKTQTLCVAYAEKFSSVIITGPNSDSLAAPNKLIVGVRKNKATDQFTIPASIFLVCSRLVKTRLDEFTLKQLRTELYNSDVHGEDRVAR